MYFVIQMMMKNAASSPKVRRRRRAAARTRTTRASSETRSPRPGDGADAGGSCSRMLLRYAFYFIPPLV